MIIHQYAAALKALKELGVHGIPQGRLLDVDVRIWGKRTWLGTAVGVDMEESSSGCNTTA